MPTCPICREKPRHGIRAYCPDCTRLYQREERRRAAQVRREMRKAGWTHGWFRQSDTGVEVRSAAQARDRDSVSVSGAIRDELERTPE